MECVAVKMLLLRSPLVCLQARSVRCEPDEADEQKARRCIRRYVENFLRVQRSMVMQIALRSVKILMDSLVVGVIVLVACSPQKAELSTQASVSRDGFAILTSDFSVGEILLLWPQAPTIAVPVHPDSKVVVPSQ